MDDKSKALPFEVERGFTAMPNSVSDYYRMHPRFTGAAERLYLYLLRNYDDKLGYAYPGYKSIRTHAKISSDDTIAKSVESLKYLGLIDVKKVRLSNGHRSNRYYFKRPIEDYGEFVRRFADDLPDKYLVEETEDSDLVDIVEWL